jgi:predicted membrane chloride channel (bestrophin family)
MRNACVQVAQKKEKKKLARESQSSTIRVLQLLKAFPFALQQHLRGVPVAASC